MGVSISEFRGEYYFLSNFYSAPVTYNGMCFENNEAAFQAAKCPERMTEFCRLNPSEAKRLGRRVKLRGDWEAVKDTVMYEICKAKFSQNPDLADKLVATKDAELIEGNTWGDRIWGVCDGVGENRLGKILMRVRAVLYTTMLIEGTLNSYLADIDKQAQERLLLLTKQIAEQENVTEQTTDHAGAIIGFQTHKGEQVHARIASSFISFEQAALNMKELGKDNIEQLAKKGKEAWNQVLGKIEVEGGNLDQYRTFYSCLYRSLLFPRKFYELDAAGQPVHYSPYNGQVLPGYMYTDTGFWDTFRCLFPLLNLMYPSVNKEMQEGLINTYKESGFLPEWASPGHRDCMVGNNSASVVADAYIKGLRGYDIETLWEALKHDANSQLPRTASGRVAYEEYNKLGYVPNNIGIGQNVARTLEYAYNDWTIYTLGKKLGKPASEIDIFKQRANNYKNVYDPKYKLMVGRSDKGEFNPSFKGTDWSRDFCEGNSWHWSFCVFHDPQGLIDLMGGKKEFNHMMDSVFKMPSRLGMDSRGMIHEMREMQVMNMGQYAHGNQPIQHMVYLYNYSGEPWKAQYWVREIMHKLYTAEADGYCGDEDNGQTSAWYVFSALGFYTVCPGTDQYVLGTPLFKSVKLHLDNGKQVLIQADKADRENRYIKGMKVNGKTYTRNFLTHEQLLGGAKIQYQMSDTPNKQRGTQDSDRPYSFSLE